MKPASSWLMHQFGIKYNVEKFTETKLLKVLNDAATASHFLHQDILAWALETKYNKYLFCSQSLEQSSQVKYLLEK
jgi:hypothetical protein